MKQQKLHDTREIPVVLPRFFVLFSSVSWWTPKKPLGQQVQQKGTPSSPAVCEVQKSSFASNLLGFFVNKNGPFGWMGY